MTDVFPRRNLGKAEQWGREVERRTRLIDRTVSVRDESFSGADRYIAASAKDIADQAAAALAAYKLLPIPVNLSTHTNSVAVGPAWSTVATLTVALNEDMSFADLVVIGDAQFDEVRQGGGGGPAQFVWPYPLEYTTDEYGPRPGIGDGFHKGLDFAGGPASAGNPIPATANGTVIGKGYQEERGNYIMLDHGMRDGNNLQTWYYHLQSPTPLSVGDSVTQGQTIGLVGNTGLSLGAHLHYETRINGDHLNPRAFMDLYGGASSTEPGPVQDIFGRLIIGGTVSQEERYPAMVGGTPLTGRQWTKVVSGGRFPVAGSSITVQLQLRSSIQSVVITNTPFASITVLGAIRA